MERRKEEETEIMSDSLFRFEFESTAMVSGIQKYITRLAFTYDKKNIMVDVLNEKKTTAKFE